MKNILSYGFVALATLLGACASSPLSYLESTVPSVSNGELLPVRIVSVDGTLQFSNPVAVEQGPRTLVLAAPSIRSQPRSIQKFYVLKVEVCTRYTLGAERSDPTDTDWQLVVVRKEPVAGCKPKQTSQSSILMATDSADAA